MALERGPIGATALVVLVAACTGGGESTTTTSLLPPTVSTTGTSAAPFDTTEPPASLPDLGGRTVTMAVDNDSFPFSFERQGESTGWDYDAIEAICDGLNCQPEFLAVEAGAVVSAVADGMAEVAGDGTIFTADLEGRVALSQPLLAVEQRLLVREDEVRFNTVGEFSASEASVGAVGDTSNHEVAVATWGSDRTIEFPDLATAVTALLAGEVDAVLTFDYAGQGYVGDGDDQVKLIQGVLGSGQVGLIFTQGSELVAPFDEALTQLLHDGTLGTLNALWFAPASSS